MFAQLPLAERPRAKALSYLAAFYNDIATDDSVRAKVLNKCIG